MGSYATERRRAGVTSDLAVKPVDAMAQSMDYERLNNQQTRVTSDLAVKPVDGHRRTRIWEKLLSPVWGSRSCGSAEHVKIRLST
jgi:hypothetical protein